MKRKSIILVFLAVVLAVIGGFTIMLFMSQNQTNPKPPDVGEFDLTKYQWEITTFPSDKNVGQVNEKSVAIEKAKDLWLEKYSTVNGKPYEPINGRKIEVTYDYKEECWHINGTLSPNTLGGVPHAIIRKSGEVVAVWIDD